ncbi:MAG TPA: ectoine/hydroxyectoine ABC transporter substrate-binding protein EhuB [Salinisphaeraceae bacterium]|nr:ectoine/hydroxyectoine ABC transporter substrate-binding protein EhuB [Salinisphaeraceae bacterium]
MFRLMRMNRLWAMGVVGMLLAGLATGAAAISLDQIKDRGFIRIAVANEKPYGYIDDEGQAMGFGPETAKQVLKELGITDIQWTVMPFGKLMDAVNSGRVDMVAAGQAILPERCEQVLFSQPNTSYGEGLLVLKGNPQKLRSFGNIAEDSEMKLGVVAGASEAGFARDSGIADEQLVELETAQDAIDALTEGRINAYAATQFTVAGLAAESDAVEAAKPYAKKPFALNPFKDPIARHKLRSWGAFSFAQDSEELRDRFDEQLQAFQQTDAWLAILKEYGLDERSIEAINKKTTEELCKMES